MSDRRPYPILCALPTTTSVKEALLYRTIHARCCADGREHLCVGQITIDRAGITLSCPRCGDARSMYPREGDATPV